MIQRDNDILEDQQKTLDFQRSMSPPPPQLTQGGTGNTQNFRDVNYINIYMQQPQSTALVPTD